MELDALVDAALAEDVGSGDVTTEATVPADARARARVVQKAPGAVFGFDVFEAVLRRLDPGVRVERLVDEGSWGEPPREVLRAEGSARALLTGERTALNFLQRLSGVASMSARAAREVQGTGARVLDTRKTTPGLRELEKAAVAAGGAVNHRAGLYDMVLIKENHIAAAGGIANAVRAARERAPDLPLEVEVRDLDEVDQALDAGAKRLLLDNMSPDELRAAVRHVDGRAELEASGGISLHKLKEVAETGIQWVSLGALTHSAPALDLSLLLEPC
jgi:nicotinate-nucleotide pyrophosphorylase (carboxylating)